MTTRIYNSTRRLSNALVIQRSPSDLNSAVVHCNEKSNDTKASDDGNGFYPPRYNHQRFRDYVEITRKQLASANVQFVVSPDEAVKMNQAPMGDGVIFVSNHHDALDQPLLINAMSHHNRQGRFIASVHNFIPKNGEGNQTKNLIAYLLQASGAFSYDKGKEANVHKTSQEALNIVKNGEHTLSFFPEGLHSHSFDTILPLYKGAASLALKAANSYESKSIWITPVIFVHQLKAGSLPVIARELALIEELLAETQGDVLKINRHNINEIQNRLLKQTTAKDREIDTQSLQIQSERILKVYLDEYKQRFPDLKTSSLDDLADHLLATSTHIVERLSKKYRINVKPDVPHLYFVNNELYEKIKNRSIDDSGNLGLIRDLADAKLAKCCYSLSQTAPLKATNRIGSNPEDLFQTLMFLRYYTLHGLTSEVVPVPKRVHLRVGNPFNVTNWNQQAKQTQGSNLELQLNDIIHSNMQTTLTTGRKEIGASKTSSLLQSRL